MAIDPITAKILTQAALKLINDEEARKKVFMIILIPIISVLLILTMFVYLIAHPWEYFGTIFSSSNATQIKQFHDKYYIVPKESNTTKNESSNDVADSK